MFLLSAILPSPPYNKKMSDLPKLLLFFFCLSAVSAQWSYCPNPNSLAIEQRTSYPISDSLTVSYGGNIPLQSGVDIQCYNYSLGQSFNSTPNVAIGTCFSTQRSMSFRVSILLICSFRSKWQLLVVFRPYRSLSELIGLIRGGPSWVFRLWRRLPLRFRRGTIKLIPRRCLPARVGRK